MEHTRRHEDLIYDVGMHKGEDTDYYLKKGFRVVAFEADPDFVNENRRKFAGAMEAGRLTIVEGAIVEDANSPSVRFYKNLDMSVWGTVDPDWASRNETLGTRSEAIDVPTVDFRKCLVDFGIPHYMKIDIEGADRVCIETLEQFRVKPCYVSIESEKVVFEKLVHELDVLSGLGYVEFAAVQQADIHKTKLPVPSMEGSPVTHVFPIGSSGLFGRDIQEAWVPKVEILEKYRRIFSSYKRFGDATVWRTNRMAIQLLRLASKVIGRPIPGWYDTHARHATCDQELQNPV